MAEAWHVMEGATNERAARLTTSLNGHIQQLSAQLEGAVNEALQVCALVAVLCQVGFQIPHCAVCRTSGSFTFWLGFPVAFLCICWGLGRFVVPVYKHLCVPCAITNNNKYVLSTALLCLCRSSSSLCPCAWQLQMPFSSTQT